MASPMPKFCTSIQRPTPDFAERVLSLEIAIETQKSVGALKELLELYSVGDI